MYFLLKSPAADAEKYGAQLSEANKGLETAIAIGLGIVVLKLIWTVIQMGTNAYRRRLAAR